VPDLIQTTRPLLIGGGQTQVLETGGYRLSIPTAPHGYADAQLDDTHDLPRHRFYWTPPLRLTVRARVDPAAAAGTWGFGLWNDPFAVSIGIRGAGRRLPCGPRALWFFYASPPNAFGFTAGPRSGWRAMAIDAPEIPAIVLTPAAIAAAVLAQVPLVRRPVMRFALSRVTAAEASLTSAPDEVHDYELVWERSHATFAVDGSVVLHAGRPPTAPLGFVAWIDNQYAVATPEDGLRFGTLPTTRAQSLDILAAAIIPGIA
jgi:hypothetical protein